MSFAEFRVRQQAEIFKAMPDLARRLSWSAKRIAAHQCDRLRALLAHAAENSRFHARRLAGVDPERFEFASLGFRS
jgi:hypothetical protein